MKTEDSPLRTEIEDGQVVIRIGVATLAFCALAKHGGRLRENERVSDPRQLAEDTMREMNRESETGETKLNRMLDDAIEEAVNQGSTAVYALKRKPREI